MGAKKLSNAADAVVVGTRIRKYRIKAGLTQSELAELVGISVNQLGKYEHGQNSLSVSALKTFANILNVKPCEICGCKS
jgi:transcriptional regulator with XRE-family HTH domain